MLVAGSRVERQEGTEVAAVDAANSATQNSCGTEKHAVGVKIKSQGNEECTKVHATPHPPHPPHRPTTPPDLHSQSVSVLCPLSLPSVILLKVFSPHSKTHHVGGPEGVETRLKIQAFTCTLVAPSDTWVVISGSLLLRCLLLWRLLW